MRGLWALAALLLILSKCSAGALLTGDYNHRFFKALRFAESSNRASVKPGDKGKSHGIYQIKSIYLADVNKVYKTNFMLSDRSDPGKAHRIVILYLTYWGRAYTRRTGKPVTYEVLARIHNGGPNGWRKQATIKYWHKVRKYL